LPRLHCAKAALFGAREAFSLSVEELQERLQWVAKLVINADAMSMPPRALAGLRTMQ
ncbi:hypothetical protein L915_22039, partial [Phytophthora nicotianae]